MPKVDGGNEKFNKKGCAEYAIQKFLDVRFDVMIKKAVKLELFYEDGVIELTISNK